MRAIGRFSLASIISAALTFGSIALALGLIIPVVALGALPFVRTPRLTVTVPVSFSLDTPGPIRSGRPGFGFEIVNENVQAGQDQKARIDRVDGSLRIPTTSRRFIAANVAALIVFTWLALLVVIQLRGLFRSLAQGQPFIPVNATRLRRVALAVVVGEFARSAVVWAENHYAMTHVTVAGLTFDAWPRMSAMTIGYGLIIFVIAEVFRVGTRLDEEQSLTI